MKSSVAHMKPRPPQTRSGMKTKRPPTTYVFPLHSAIYIFIEMHTIGDVITLTIFFTPGPRR